MNAVISPIKRRKDDTEKIKNAFSLIDHLENWKKKILLAESNTSNPGMYKDHALHF